MTSNIELGHLRPVDLREAFPDEARNFTPWLAEPENLAQLGDELKIRLEPGSTEESVGDFRADVFCTEASSGATVVIENQLNRTDNNHLGQILLYVAGLDAVTVVWIAKEFLDEHRAVFEWLNEKTEPSVRFFGVEVGLWSIGDSAPAPKFVIVVQPEDGRSEGLTERQRWNQEFWELVNSKLLTVFKPKPSKHQSKFFGVLRKGFKLRGSFNKNQLEVALVIDGDNAYDYAKRLETESDDIENSIGSEVKWKFQEGSSVNRVFLDRPGSVHDASAVPKGREIDELAGWMASRLELFRGDFADRVQFLELPSTEIDTDRS